MNKYFEELCPEVFTSIEEDIIQNNPNITKSQLKSKITIDYIMEIASDIMPDYEGQLSVITENANGKYTGEKGIYSAFKLFMDNYSVPSNPDSFFKNTAALTLASWFMAAYIDDDDGLYVLYEEVTSGYSDSTEEPVEEEEGEE